MWDARHLKTWARLLDSEEVLQNSFSISFLRLSSDLEMANGILTIMKKHLYIVGGGAQKQASKVKPAERIDNILS